MTRYLITWLLLVALAAASLLASHAGGGMVIALVIAAIKAALVAAVFMHLAGGRAVHRMAFAAAIAFIALLIFGVVADVGLRSRASAYVDDRGTP